MLDPMLARARMQILGRHRVRSLTLALGVAAIAVGALMAAGRQWGAAAMSTLVGGLVTWLAGAWVLPGGGDAYCMRVRRGVREGVGKMAGSYEMFERYARRQRARVLRLQPPAALHEEHARLVDLLDEADRSATDLSRSLKARAADTTRSLQRAREQRTALIERRDDANARYTKAIGDLAKSSESLIAGAFDRAEDVVGGMVAKLERTDPPTRLAVRHDALLESSRSYLEAMRAYHDAVRELDPDRVGDAVNRCEQARSAIEEKLMALCGDAAPVR
jgi:hypothetical protein